MKIRTKILLGFLFSIIPAIIIGIIAIIQINNIAQPITRTIPQSIQSIKNTSYLDNSASYIRYYDEVLTQSARNYAFTGDTKWKTRYYDIVPKLDNLIKNAISKGDSKDKQIFSGIDKANLALVQMEEASMAYVEQNNKNKAIEVLESSEYARQKQIYQQGLVQYSTNKGEGYNLAISSSIANLDLLINKSQILINSSIVIVLFVIIAGLIFIVLLAYYVSSYIVKPLLTLCDTSQQISKGNFKIRTLITNKDEIGQLAQSFNQMADELGKSRENIEQKVAERTEQLEKLNKFMVDREIKMAQLKKEINKLQTGKPE